MTSVTVIEFDESTGKPTVIPGSLKDVEVSEAWLQYFVDSVWNAALEKAEAACEGMGALDSLSGEEQGSAAMVRVADRQADLCAAAIKALMVSK